jgi:hypothetical protein
LSFFACGFVVITGYITKRLNYSFSDFFTLSDLKKRNKEVSRPLLSPALVCLQDPVELQKFREPALRVALPEIIAHPWFLCGKTRRSHKPV